jgi:hypothetical protein
MCPTCHAFVRTGFRADAAAPHWASGEALWFAPRVPRQQLVAVHRDGGSTRCSRKGQGCCSKPAGAAPAGSTPASFPGPDATTAFPWHPSSTNAARAAMVCSHGSAQATAGRKPTKSVPLLGAGNGAPHARASALTSTDARLKRCWRLLEYEVSRHAVQRRPTANLCRTDLEQCVRQHGTMSRPAVVNITRVESLACRGTI